MKSSVIRNIFLFAAILVFEIMMIKSAIATYEVRWWPVAEGEIVSSKIVQVTTGRNLTGRKNVVLYKYTVGGRTYTSKGIKRSSSVSTDPAYAAAMAKIWYVGAPVKVYYSPSNPSEAYLQYNLDAGNLAVTLVPLCFLVCIAWDTVTLLKGDSTKYPSLGLK
ncbi:MAG: DUF3592 domain-containing protein [Phycisphaeraceae bacterium JB051]